MQAAHTAAVVNELSHEMMRILEAHPLAAERAAAGLNPANCVLLRGCGSRIQVRCPSCRQALLGRMWLASQRPLEAVSHCVRHMRRSPLCTHNAALVFGQLPEGAGTQHVSIRYKMRQLVSEVLHCRIRS
jgi:hypothetical protein